jgi:hypothetical protein
MAKEKDQLSRRRNIILNDQFGRKWQSTIDVDSMGTCAPINPYNFKAPLDTPQKYVRHAGETDIGKVYIDVDRWLEDTKEAHNAWEATLHAWAQQVAPNAALQLISEPTPDLLRLVGPQPVPVELVLAVKQKNGFVLGTRTFDATRESDRKLLELLTAWKRTVEGTLADFGDEESEQSFGDEAEDESVKELKQAAQVRRPRDKTKNAPDAPALVTESV